MGAFQSCKSKLQLLEYHDDPKEELPPSPQLLSDGSRSIVTDSGAPNVPASVLNDPATFELFFPKDKSSYALSSSGDSTLLYYDAPSEEKFDDETNDAGEFPSHQASTYFAVYKHN